MDFLQRIIIDLKQIKLRIEIIKLIGLLNICITLFVNNFNAANFKTAKCGFFVLRINS